MPRKLPYIHFISSDIEQTRGKHVNKLPAVMGFLNGRESKRIPVRKLRDVIDSAMKKNRQEKFLSHVEAEWDTPRGLCLPKIEVPSNNLFERNRHYCILTIFKAR